MSTDFTSHDLPPATRLTNAELCKYAQMKLDVQARLPIEWQQELLRRFTKALDHITASYTQDY